MSTNQSLVAKFAARYSIDAEKLLPILKATAFKVRDGEATNEQMAALLVVADQYGLNPFTREIFAFPDKQSGIVPVVGVDGWSRIINDHPQSDGLEFVDAEQMATIADAKPCPAWMECVIHRKDRSHPIKVREYLDEVYQAPRGGYRGPWQTHTKRMLRHKVLIQAARLAYGFTGIFDEDEAERIIERDVTPPAQIERERGAGAALKAAVSGGGGGNPTPPQAETLPGAANSALEADSGVGKEPETVVPTGGAAKKGDIGTPKLRKVYLEKLAGCKDRDVLDLLFDETTMYVWSADDHKLLSDAYATRRIEIVG